MFLLSSALVLGFLHGLGADHLMAIAALSMDGDPGDRPAACPEQNRSAVRRARALGVAIKFAVGHALLLGIGASLIVLIGWSIPPHVERGGEMLGGALLIVMGLVTLQHLYKHHAPHSSTEHRASRTKDRAPSTQHRAPSTEPSAPSTEHPAPSTEHPAPSTEHRAPSTQHPAPSTQHPAPSTQHSHLPTMIGAAFAVSSLRALAMLTPFGAGLGPEPLSVLLALIVVFAVGILISMSLFGVALAGVLSTTALARVGHGAGALVGVSSVLLGVAWVVTA